MGSFPVDKRKTKIRGPKDCRCAVPLPVFMVNEILCLFFDVKVTKKKVLSGSLLSHATTTVRRSTGSTVVAEYSVR